jgi:hypothetical protein
MEKRIFIALKTISSRMINARIWTIKMPLLIFLNEIFIDEK